MSPSTLREQQECAPRVLSVAVQGQVSSRLMLPHLHAHEFDIHVEFLMLLLMVLLLLLRGEPWEFEMSLRKVEGMSQRSCWV